MTMTLTIAFKIKPDRLADFAALLTQVQNELPGTKGCRDLRVLQNADVADEILLIERWSSREAHRAHIDEVIASGGWEHVAIHLAADPVSTYFTET
ncbi:antibiotic biosynthesis monooxygenase family protein [Tabrizicola sp.]|uniref:putative quinol monooxygenase n=1 Tax=Tabrizicola sp. TaxID=2005166 RepID=UPI00286BAF91|nr:antibiotic biosynthesis monooxygenase family protein [Tabrizicola sp.]